MDPVLVGSVWWGGWLLKVASVAAIRAGDAGASVAYYVDQVSRDRHDYYAEHGETPGVWHGGFAEHLGLSGHVAAEDLRMVLEGRDPTTGELLKPRANRRVAAWDVTFSPPKSISALWALAPDDARQRVRKAQAAAVDVAIGYLTAHACVARLGRDAIDRQDGAQLGFLRADFTHRCSREGDPQVHTHAILVNLLQASDGRRAALDGGILFQHAKAADGIYQAALRAELSQRLGVGWERRDERRSPASHSGSVDSGPSGAARSPQPSPPGGSTPTPPRAAPPRPQRSRPATPRCRSATRVAARPLPPRGDHFWPRPDRHP